MLSRIARGLYAMGRSLEHAQNLIRILEVNHKMHLERESLEESNVWTAIAEAFGVSTAAPSEAELYARLVFDAAYPDSVLGAVRAAREQGRATRDHISEEMWLVLNEFYLELRGLGFGDVLRRGRSEFNRDIERFCDGFHGLGASTMNHGAPWHFLRTGRFLERASSICLILEIKRKTLLLHPESAGRPVDVHQWQTLLRSLSGYEPYRRAYDARIVPARVLHFVLRGSEFPRSLQFSLARVAASLRRVASSNPAQAEVQLLVEELLGDVRRLDCEGVLVSGELESVNRSLALRCRALHEALEVAYFGSLRPAPAPIAQASGATQVPQ